MTVEFVIWVPVFMMIILLAADVSLVFMRQSNFWTVSQSAARIVARHGMDSHAAEEYVRQQASFAGYTPEVDVQISDDTVSVTISASARKLAPFGVLSLALGNQVSAKATQTLEPM